MKNIPTVAWCFCLKWFTLQKEWFVIKEPPTNIFMTEQGPYPTVKNCSVRQWKTEDGCQMTCPWYSITQLACALIYLTKLQSNACARSIAFLYVRAHPKKGTNTVALWKEMAFCLADRKLGVPRQGNLDFLFVSVLLQIQRWMWIFPVRSYAIHGFCVFSLDNYSVSLFLPLLSLPVIVVIMDYCKCDTYVFYWRALCL